MVVSHDSEDNRTTGDTVPRAAQQRVHEGFRAWREFHELAKGGRVLERGDHRRQAGTRAEVAERMTLLLHISVAIVLVTVAGDGIALVGVSRCGSVNELRSDTHSHRRPSQASWPTSSPAPRYNSAKSCWAWSPLAPTHSGAESCSVERSPDGARPGESPTPGPSAERRSATSAARSDATIERADLCVAPRRASSRHACRAPRTGRRAVAPTRASGVSCARRSARSLLGLATTRFAPI